MKTTLISVLIACLFGGCTGFYSLGKQYEFDEVVIRKYRSQTDLPPELLAIIKSLAAQQQEAGPMAGAGTIYPDCVTVDVTRVYDGDTFYCDIPGWPDIIGHQIGIRITDMDTPEIRGKSEQEKELALQAKEVATELLENATTVQLCNLQRDKYFRINADVYADGLSIKDELIKQGLAVPYDGGTKTKDWSEPHADQDL